MFKIVICSSSGGGNFEYIVKNQNENFKVTRLIVDKECGAITKALENDIPIYRINNKKLSKLSSAIDSVVPHNTDLIVLAGFMPILSKEFCQKWSQKIINTHPSLLPKYGGIGMYGVKVQEAVMSSKEKYAGCSVHYVNEKVDMGEVLAQESIKVNYDESPWELGGRIHNIEKKLLLSTINQLISEKSVYQ
tara:strand:- start:123 stop:695 length:573 start_codon:yes stop_codon:yes gene_type:complete